MIYYMKKILPFVIILIVGIVIGWLCRQSCIRPETIIQRDTLVRIDTVKELYPVSIREEIVDTLRIVIRDTIRVKDTLYMDLPLEKRSYKREDFYAEVTGYDPRLTYIEVYPKTVYINESVTMQPHRWQFSLDLGVDVGRAYNPYFAPNLGVEISLDKWSLNGAIGCSLDMLENNLLEPSLYYEIGLRYSLIKR